MADGFFTASSFLPYNPHKFSVWISAGAPSPNNTTLLIPFDSEEYDTGNNMDIVTNKGRFTAPVAGYYHFNTGVEFASNSQILLIDFYKNGALVKRGQRTKGQADNTNLTGSCLLSLAAGDYVEVFAYAGATTAVSVGQALTYFQGFLVSLK